MMQNIDSQEIIHKFNNLKTREDVAEILGVSEKAIRYLLYSKPREKLFTEFNIVKKNGEERYICAPSPYLKLVQSRLLYILSLIYRPKVCTYGFIKGKNIVGNARGHIKKKCILNIDLKDYFHQILFGRIQGLLRSKPYELGNEAAMTIAGLACYKGCLRQGLPTSPILSNMICVSLDNHMMKLAKKHRIFYSRYADDITLSTTRAAFPTEIAVFNQDKWEIGIELAETLRRANFLVNSKKTTMRTKHQRQEVTGIIVNQHLNVKREYLRNLRAILFSCKKNGIIETVKRYSALGYCKNETIKTAIEDPEKGKVVIEWFATVIRGKISYISVIKGKQDLTYLSYAKEANIVFERELFDISSLVCLEDIYKKNVYALEGTKGDTLYSGSGFYISDIGLITCHHLISKADSFDVSRDNNPDSKTCVGNIISSSAICFDENLDYAVYKIDIPETIYLDYADSSGLEIGYRVRIAGFPDGGTRDSITATTCEIIGKSSKNGYPLYKVNARINFGTSGGVVLNMDNNVVGIVRTGISSTADEEQTSGPHGFTPIHEIINDIRIKRG